MPYTPATPAMLRERFPVFEAVTDDAVNLWLDDARLTVTDAWVEADRAPGEMELAAHNLVLNGHGKTAGAVGDLAAMGVSSFKSASFSVNFKETGRGEGYGATMYGSLFKVRLRRNAGGPRLVGCA